MKKAPSKDLVLFLVLSILIVVFTSIKLIDNFIMDIILFILIFVSSGYSLIAVLYPEENHKGLLKKPLLFLELSVFLTVLVSVILKYSSLGLQFRDLILILSLTTIVLTITTYVLRTNQFKANLGEEKHAEPVTTSEMLTFTSKGGLPYLTALTILSLLMIITVIVPPLNKTALWMVPGSLFICFIPGYLLLAIMFPKNDDLELIERLALAGGASLILTSLVGLTFNYTSWSIRLELILIVLAVFSLLFSLITIFRMKKLPSEMRLSIPKLEKILTIFLILCIILTIGTAGYTLIKPSGNGTTDKNNTTDFYIKGIDGNTLNLSSGTKNNITAVIVNQEGRAINYSILVRVNTTILKQDNITLQNNQKIEIPVDFTAGTPGQRKIEFILYKLPSDKPYKTRDLLMNIN